MYTAGSQGALLLVVPSSSSSEAQDATDAETLDSYGAQLARYPYTAPTAQFHAAQRDYNLVDWRMDGDPAATMRQQSECVRLTSPVPLRTMGPAAQPGQDAI